MHHKTKTIIFITFSCQHQLQESIRHTLAPPPPTTDPHPPSHSPTPNQPPPPPPTPHLPLTPTLSHPPPTPNQPSPPTNPHPQPTTPTHPQPTTPNYPTPTPTTTHSQPTTPNHPQPTTQPSEKIAYKNCGHPDLVLMCFSTVFTGVFVANNAVNSTIQYLQPIYVCHNVCIWCG